jgi:DNA-binding MarR family transcriptional regulator
MKLEDAIKSNKFKDTRHKVTLNILYTAYWLKASISSRMKEEGLTSEQFNVMRILKGKNPEQMCVKDIGSRMIEKSSNVPRIVDRLVAKKLVKRTTSKEDKRETLIALTDKGLQHLEALNKMIDELSEDIIGIDEKEAELLNELLEKLRKDN